MGDRFPLPVNTGSVDGRAFPLAELTGRQLGPSTRVVETGLNCEFCEWFQLLTFYDVLVPYVTRFTMYRAIGIVHLRF